MTTTLTLVCLCNLAHIHVYMYLVYVWVYSSVWPHSVVFSNLHLQHVDRLGLLFGLHLWTGGCPS